MAMRGYCGIGIYNVKNSINVGGLWRSAHAFGANFIFTIGRRYQKQASDTTKAGKHIPLYHYESFQDFYDHKPLNNFLIGIEIAKNSKDIKNFVHFERSIYLLGAEDSGLPEHVMQKCNALIQIPTEFCLNVATTGAIVLYDRKVKCTSTN